MSNAELTPIEIHNRVYKLVSEHLGVSQDRIKDDSDLVNDLGADSLDLIEIVMGVEEAFDIEITEEEVTATATVDSVINLVTKKITAAGRAMVHIDLSPLRD